MTIEIPEWLYWWFIGSIAGTAVVGLAIVCLLLMHALGLV